MPTYPLLRQLIHCSSYPKNGRAFKSKHIPHTVTAASAATFLSSTDDDALVEGRKQDSLSSLEDGLGFFRLSLGVTIRGLWIFPLFPLASSADSELLFLQIKDKNPNGFRPPLLKKIQSGCHRIAP